MCRGKAYMALKYDLSMAVLLCALLSFGLMFFVFHQRAKSEVLISDRMSEFIDAIDQSQVKKERQLVVYDLDDTVFKMSSIIGSPTWYYNMVNALKQRGVASFEAFYVVGEIDRIIQENIEVIPVEQATLRAIKTWQALGVNVVAVTSRPKSFQAITETHLQQIELQFNAPVFQCVENAWEEPSSTFKNGIIYAGNKITKNDAIIVFFNLATQCGLQIELLAQADDQQRYISKISKFAENNNVNFIGIIYGGALSNTEFNPKEASQKLHELEARLDRSIVPIEYRNIFFID